MILTLKRPAELRVVSDDSLIESINDDLKKKEQEDKKKKRKNAPTSVKAPAVIADVDPSVDFELRPIEMLLELGAAMLPPLPNHLRLASRWAILRYGWALAAPVGALAPLRLSSYGLNLRYHHRTLMSEELGVGLACWTCGQLLAARNPGASVMRVDAETALSLGAGPIVVPASGTVTVSSTIKRPDYFFIAYDPSAAKIREVVVLECKGTHAADHVSKQLGDAMRQVAAVSVRGGSTVTLQAFGAYLNAHRIRLYGVDPQGANELAGVAAARTSRHDKTVVITRGEHESYEITDLARFRRRLLDVSAAQLLCWAGLSAQARARLLGETDSAPINLDELEHREMNTGQFVGVSSTLPIDEGERYTSFFGLDKRVAASLLADEDAAEATALEDFARRAEPFRAGVRHVALDSPQDDGSVAGASLDGLFFEVRAC
jgi:hypothetical protein